MVTQWIEVEKNKSIQRKNTLFCFRFVDFKLFFSLNIHCYLDITIVLPWLKKIEVPDPFCGEQSHLLGRRCPPFQIKKRVGANWVLQVRFRTHDGITRRVTGVWVLPLPTYFNWCPFLLDNPNWSYPLWEKLCKICSSNRGKNLPVIVLVIGGFIRESQATVYCITINIRK